MGSGSGTTAVPIIAERRIAKLAAWQYGVFSRDQALSLGVPRTTLHRRSRSGRWEVVFPGVFRLPGAPRSWHQQVMAACLAWGPGCAASHRSAAPLWSLAGFEKGLVELVVPRGREGPAPGIIVHRPRTLLRADVVDIGAIPVTTAVRTLIDLAGVVAENALEEALDDALRRRLVTIPRLAERVSQAGSVKGIKTIRRLVADRHPVSPLSESVLETRWRRLFTRLGLEPVPQYEVWHRGELIARLDFAFPDVRVGIEADGYRWHSGRERWQHDLRRRNALLAIGWRVFHVTWSDLDDDPEALVRRILEASKRV